MKNRIPTHAGRVRLIPVDGEENVFDMIRADEPIEEGTPLNKQLLDFAVAANGTTAGTSTAYTLDDMFGGFALVDGSKINFRLHVDSGENATINVNGTGAKPIMVDSRTPMRSNIVAGTWCTAIYSAVFDCFILGGTSISYFEASAYASNWARDRKNGGYSVTVDVEGMLATDKPVVDVILTYNATTNKAIKKAWACIDKVVSLDGALTLWGEKDVLPSDFNFQIMVVR